MKSNPILQSSPVSPSAPLPPYGRDVEELLVAGDLVDPWIMTGRDAWKHAKRRRNVINKGSALVLPEGCSAREFRWPVSGLAVTAWVTDLAESERLELGKTLVACGAEMAVLLDGTGNPMWFRKSS